MTLRMEDRSKIPSETDELGQKLLSQENPYRLIGERLADLIRDEDFADLFSLIGGPAISPVILVLVTIFQSMEKRPDRQAAEDVRVRIDWKYALHLPLDDNGFHFTNLSHFRQRLLQNQAEYRVFDRLLQRLIELGLVRLQGRQRTDSTHVLGLVANLSRLELVWESLRLALRALEKEDETWLRRTIPGIFLEQYLIRCSEYNLKTEEIQIQLKQAGADGFWLLQQLEQAPSALQELEAVRTLKIVWEQQFEQDDQNHYRGPRTQLQAHELIQNPHEPEVRYRTKRGKPWKGYSAQITETAEDKEEPSFITDIGVNSAQTDDTTALPAIQKRLADRQLLPSEQVVDQNYLSGLLLAQSQAQGIHLIGPIIAQPGTEGFQQDAFQIDLEHRQATCPSGKQSFSSSASSRNGSLVYRFRFGQQCLTCSLQPQCTQSKRGRTIAYDKYHPFVVQHRLFMQSKAFRLIMKSRPAVEGTISQLVRQGLRQARYRGQRKVNLQAIFLAVVVNLKRLFRFWRSVRQPRWAVTA